MLKIFEISLIPTRSVKGLAFFASFVLDNKFYVGNVALVSRLDGSGFRCVYPTKVLPNGTQIPIFYPINKATGSIIEKTLSDEANRLFNTPEERLKGKYVFGVGERRDQ